MCKYAFFVSFLVFFWCVTHVYFNPKKCCLFLYKCVYCVFIMNRSTPIESLRRDELIDATTRDMVDGIVNELDPQGGGYEHMSPQTMDYGAPQENSMYPQEMMGGYQQEPMMRPGDPRAASPQQMMMTLQHQQMLQPQQQQMMQPQQTDTGMMGKLTDMFIHNSREPMLAGVLFLIMSNDTVSSLLSRYIPYAASPLIGLVIRAILVAVLFFGAKTFVLKK